jgi:hypothetical protein
MIWAITIATFLGTVFAVALILFIFFRREQHRMESRTPARVGVEVSSPDEPSIIEIALTENVSRHGARVVTKRQWGPNDSVIVKLLRGNQRLGARIAYCKPSKRDAFAVGLQFSSAVGSWMGPRGGLTAKGAEVLSPLTEAPRLFSIRWPKS